MTIPRRALLDLYSAAPLTARVHLAVRWATCPFPAVAAAVPAGGPVLEVGCGHGLLSSYLGLVEPGRRVHGVDLDPNRIALAHLAAAKSLRHGATLSFATAEPGALPTGPWAAVALVDVLYLVPPAAQRRLVDDCVAGLEPGGSLVIKETDTARRWRAGVTLAQETLAVRLLHFTSGHRPAFVPPARLSGWMMAAGLEVTAKDLGRGYLHPHHLLVGRRN